MNASADKIQASSGQRKRVRCNEIVKTCENWPSRKCLWKSWTVFNTMGDATDAVMVRDAIKNMLDKRWRKPQQGTALTFSTKEHIILGKWKEHQRDLLENNPWK